MLDFGVGWSELLVIGIVALVVIGPKELPGALRTLGQWMGKIRRMASEFQGQFQEAMREAEIDQLKKDMDDMAAKAKGFDPMDDIRRDIERTIGDVPPLDQPAKPPEVATAPPAPDTPATVPSSQVAAEATPSAPASAEQVATTHAPAQPAQPEPALAGGKTDTART
jgi:sec-independent protein translocase protein TatB